MKRCIVALLAALATATAVPVLAQVKITEVSAWGSGNSPYASDWFELTNTGPSTVNITGWKMDDNSNSFAAAVALTGITTIASGESVIFLESAVNASFLSTWFGANAPAGLQIGNYSGSGVGLSTGGDAVNLYNSAGVLQANVSFGSSDASTPFQTFDNAGGLNNAPISQLSLAGVNGAFIAANDFAEIGSPGVIAAATAVPEPEIYAMLLAGIGLMGGIARKRLA